MAHTEFPYLYPYSVEEARQRDEISRWRESFRVNIACKEAIEAAIRRDFDGMSLKADCAKSVIDSEKGIFIAMPQESYTKNGEKKYTDTFHAVTAEARTALLNAVDAAYAQKLEDLEEEAEEAPEPGMEMSMEY